jgi:hypothetical protein
MEAEMIYDEIRVDKNNLDEEWERQSRSSFDFGKDLADARQEMAHKKRLMDLALADAMDFVLQNYEDYGLNKQQANSSTFVRNAALKSDEYQNAYKDFINAEHDVNVLQAASYAMLDKKMSLEYLTKLFLADYYTMETTVDDYRREQLREKVAGNPRLRRKQEDGSADYDS